MAPRRLPEGDPPPIYGAGTNNFSVGIWHGGFFVGNGSNRSYVDGSVIWFDDCDTETWSRAMVENLVEEIGYEMQGRIRAHYLIPILTMARNGRREIRSDDDTQFMSTFVGIGHHFFSIYLDHDDSIRARDWDDVVEFPMVDLPPVVSPAKPLSLDDEEGEVEDAPVPLSVIYDTEEEEVRAREGMRSRSSKSNVREEEVRAMEGMRTRSSKSNVREQEVVREREGMRTRSSQNNVREQEEVAEGDEDANIGEEDDQDADFNMHDSDYEISDDDDLFANHVDEDEGEVKKQSVHGKEKMEEEDDSEPDDLWAPDSEDEKVKIRFKTFREEDLKDPKFTVGQMFETVDMLRKSIRE
ncbi:hypothetical protein ACQ4PT_040953 [Festuca glaucescens]